MKTELKLFVKESPLMGYGWGNGYVCLPEGHPCFGMHYDDIHSNYDINVNGGLTFSEPSENLTSWSEVPVGKWWVVGFDTAHYGDTPERWPDADSVIREANELLDQLKQLES